MKKLLRTDANYLSGTVPVYHTGLPSHCKYFWQRLSLAPSKCVSPLSILSSDPSSLRCIYCQFSSLVRANDCPPLQAPGTLLEETVRKDVNASGLVNVVDTTGVFLRIHSLHLLCKASNTRFTLYRTLISLQVGQISLRRFHGSALWLVTTSA